MLVRVLGPVIVVNNLGETVEVLRKKPREVLALLLLAPNVPHSARYLIETMWHGHAPKSAASNMRSHVTYLRRLMSPGDPQLAPLRTVTDGYLLALGADELDVGVFQSLAADGREKVRAGALSSAHEAFERAIRLWRGDPFHGVELSADLLAWAERLQEEYRNVMEDLFDVRLALGRHNEVIGHLQAWTSKHALRERAHAQLMIALYRSGRRAEALLAYQSLYHILVAQAGLEPTQAIRDLHQHILLGDPRLTLPQL